MPRIVSAEDARKLSHLAKRDQILHPEVVVPDLARTVVVQAEQIAALRKIALNQIPHRYEGRCPDRTEGPNPRDPDCPACQILELTA